MHDIFFYETLDDKDNQNNSLSYINNHDCKCIFIKIPIISIFSSWCSSNYLTIEYWLLFRYLSCLPDWKEYAIMLLRSICDIYYSFLLKMVTVYQCCFYLSLKLEVYITMLELYGWLHLYSRNASLWSLLNKCV